VSLSQHGSRVDVQCETSFYHSGSPYTFYRLRLLRLLTITRDDACQANSHIDSHDEGDEEERDV